MLKAVLCLSALVLASCGGGAQPMTASDGTTTPGEANFSFCFGFCLHRIGPPLVQTIVQPTPAPPVAMPKR